MRVFFYGLFMDESLLARKGITPVGVRPGFVEDFGLRIGERATLVPRPGSRAYGAMMDIASDDLTMLYGEDSLADYAPAPVTVTLMDGTRYEATCYILPGGKATRTNKTYAQSLLAIATKLEFPDSYLDEIRNSQA